MRGAQLVRLDEDAGVFGAEEPDDLRAQTTPFQPPLSAWIHVPVSWSVRTIFALTQRGLRCDADSPQRLAQGLARDDGFQASNSEDPTVPGSSLCEVGMSLSWLVSCLADLCRVILKSDYVLCRSICIYGCLL